MNIYGVDKFPDNHAQRDGFDECYKDEEDQSEE